MTRPHRSQAPTPDDLRRQYAEHFWARKSDDPRTRRAHRYDARGYCPTCLAQLEWLEPESN